jgi:hypothetical protein
VLPLLVLALALTADPVQTPPASATESAEVSTGPSASTIAALGSFDLATRTGSARSIRRMTPAQAGPALEAAALHHANDYVRFRAFVLLTGVDPAAAERVARAAMTDRSDRLRVVAFEWFEHHPDPSIVPALLVALGRESSEFVRPALSRAAAALGTDARIQAALAPLVLRGEDFYRGAVINALADYGGDYAADQISSVANLDGPLQDDAVLALGRIGRPSSRAQIAGLQSTAPSERQPSISAALCLLGVDCEARLAYLERALAFGVAGGRQEPLLDETVRALCALVKSGKPKALAMLLDAADGAPEAAREAISVGLAEVALARPTIVLSGLEGRPDLAQVAEMLFEGFDIVSEDFDEERFYLETRKVYWESPAGSTRRAMAEMLIQKLEF